MDGYTHNDAEMFRKPSKRIPAWGEGASKSRSDGEDSGGAKTLTFKPTDGQRKVLQNQPDAGVEQSKIVDQRRNQRFSGSQTIPDSVPPGKMGVVKPDFCSLCSTMYPEFMFRSHDCLDLVGNRINPGPNSWNPDVCGLCLSMSKVGVKTKFHNCLNGIGDEYYELYMAEHLFPDHDHQPYDHKPSGNQTPKGTRKVEEEQSNMVNGREVITQKGKSVISITAPYDGSAYLKRSLANGAKVAPQEPKKNFPFFARPCPASPRHGFVDSRVVHNRYEWLELLQELMECNEEDWEIVCMDFMEADWNGIVNPSGLTIGEGHEGATSGRNAISIPAPADNEESFDKVYAIQRELANVQEYPYVEVVGQLKMKKRYGSFTKRDDVQAVQVRDGPRVTFEKERVPTPIVVEKVVEAGGDLQEWEKRARRMAESSENIVVHHPDGSLASHYAVHCVVNDVPIVCRESAPKVGDRLEETDDGGSLTQADYDKMARYISAYDSGSIFREKKNRRPVCRLAISALHAQNYWDDSEHLLRARSLGILAAARLAAAAVLGESRHFDGCGPGRFDLFSSLWDGDDGPAAGVLHGGSRKSIYNEAGGESLPSLFFLLKGARADFNIHGWTPGYGGENWAECAYQTFRLLGSLARFLENPSEGTWNDALTAWNSVIHVSHNGSFLLTKFVKERFFDDAASVPSCGFLSSRVLNHIHFSPPSPDDYSDTVTLGEEMVEAYLEADRLEYGDSFTDSNALITWHHNPYDVNDPIYFEVVGDGMSSFKVDADSFTRDELKDLADTSRTVRPPMGESGEHRATAGYIGTNGDVYVETFGGGIVIEEEDRY